ncbi:MAG TPA: hypothetical protein DIT25_00800 [Candidatus Moranbacteria bacterium]|nr:hypothetical protein [Candidatus Moranbacteria bacterium]
MNITFLFSKLGLSDDLSQDIMLLIFIAFVSFVYGILIGRTRLMTVLINIYVAYAVVAVVPQEIFDGYELKILAFLGILALLTVLNKRFFDISLSGSGSGFLFRVFSMSFLQVVLVLSIAFSFFPENAAMEYISGSAYEYLVSGWAPLVWMIAPLLLMFYIYKKIRR